MSGLIKSIFQGIYGDRKSNYMYDVLESTPLLHSPDQLRNLCNGASKEQKASVYRHMVDFEVHDREDLPDYYNLSRELWDEFSK